MLILGINFCPCKNSLIETLFCIYCCYVRNKSSKLHTHETDFFRLALRSKVQVRRELVQPTFAMRLIGQLWRAQSLLFSYINFVGFLNKTFSVRCEHLNRAVAGRSRFNCHCEGLIVFYFFKIQFRSVCSHLVSRTSRLYINI